MLQIPKAIHVPIWTSRELARTLAEKNGSSIERPDQNIPDEATIRTSAAPMATQDSYVITLADDYTVTRDGPTAPFDVVGPLIWRITIDGVSKLQRNAMNELSHKYNGAPGAYEQWLEKQERSDDGALTCACVSNKLSYTVKPKAVPVALNPKKWVALPLESRIDINHNTRRLRFRLPVEDLGLPVGMHIFLKGKVNPNPHPPPSRPPPPPPFLTHLHHLRPYPPPSPPPPPP